MVVRVMSWSDQDKKYSYEERITAWNANSFEEAIDKAEKECKEYVASDDLIDEHLDLFQAFMLDTDIANIKDGTEVFSLIRDSDLAPSDYINSFFDTGHERHGTYKAPK